MKENLISRRQLLAAGTAFTFTALTGCGKAQQPADSQSSQPASSQPASSEQPQSGETAPVHFEIAGLKGPTTMGLANLKSWAEAGSLRQDYAVTMYTTADEVVPLLVKKQVDCAAIPCNLAATLYQKTEGALQVAAINTLGVLYVVEQGDTVHSVADLKGRTLYTTGEGTTPEYTLRHLLRQNDIDPDRDVEIVFLSAADQVVSTLTTMTDGIAMLPQPMVTSAQMKIEGLRVALDVTEEWAKVAPGELVTGVLVVRREFVQQNEAAFREFLQDYADSAAAAVSDLAGTAAMCEEYGVVAKAAIAQKALPHCNIVCITGEQMQSDVQSYLEVLYQADPAAVGGAMPEDDFYYVG